MSADTQTKSGAGTVTEAATPENAPLVIIVSGPSGSGKSTLVQKILALPGTMLSISCTTRPRRATESTGKCYDFVSEAEFDAMWTDLVALMKVGFRRGKIVVVRPEDDHGLPSYGPGA